MTREEAKEKLYMEWQKFLEDNIDYAGISEAYKMAFKALEQEPCEDAISRQAAIRVCCGMSRFTGIDEAPYEYVEDVLRKLPSVTPQPKTGHWIANKAKHYPGWVHCSECGEDWTHDGRPLYCPACGARMRKEK